MSGKQQSSEIDLDIVKHGKGSDVTCGESLVRFVDAVLDRNADAITTARDGVCKELRERAAHDAAAVIAMFQLNSRVADACGIPLDAFGEESRRRLGADLGFETALKDLGAPGSTPSDT